LKVERNAGQLVLSWNRNADIVKTAQKATLTITDGASTEDDDLDLGTLRGGSVVYSAITNDVGFKLEVSDLKNRKSLSESIRALPDGPAPPRSRRRFPAQTGQPNSSGRQPDADQTVRSARSPPHQRP